MRSFEILSCLKKQRNYYKLWLQAGMKDLRIKWHLTWLLYMCKNHKHLWRKLQSPRTALRFEKVHCQGDDKPDTGKTSFKNWICWLLPRAQHWEDGTRQANSDIHRPIFFKCWTRETVFFLFNYAQKKEKNKKTWIGFVCMSICNKLLEIIWLLVLI